MACTAHSQKAVLIIETGYTTRVTSIATSRGRRILASGSDDNTIKLWDAVRGREQILSATIETRSLLPLSARWALCSIGELRWFNLHPDLAARFLGNLYRL